MKPPARPGEGAIAGLHDPEPEKERAFYID